MYIAKKGKKEKKKKKREKKEKKEKKETKSMNDIRKYSVTAVAILLVFFIGCMRPQRIDFKAPPTVSEQPWTESEFRNDPDNFQFAVVSDRTGGARPGIFRKAMTQLNLLQPEFVMSVGDLIEGYTESHETLKAQFDEIDSILDSLEMRFFRVAGNHDISNSVMTEVYRERYELPYYHFVYKNVLFLIICTEDPTADTISDAQVSYMEKALKDSGNVRWTLIFMHKPLFIEIEGKLHENWAKIENMLKDRPHTLFAGHVHTYAKHEKHGRSYICLATTGGGSDLSGIETGKFDHVVWVTMTEAGPRIANLLLDGIHDENVRTTE